MNDALIGELQYEMVSTVKCLERIPADRLDWKPHEKSMSLRQLALHTAEIPGYAAMIVDVDGIDMATMDYKPAEANSAEELVALLKRNVAIAVEKLTAADLEGRWSLRNGEQVIFDLPRPQVVRSMMLNHFIHHRGQLSVYLRLLDIPVPSIYGPSADEAN